MKKGKGTGREAVMKKREDRRMANFLKEEYRPNEITLI